MSKILLGGASIAVMWGIVWASMLVDYIWVFHRLPDGSGALFNWIFGL